MIYAATGQKHLKRALISAESLKRHCPNLHTLCFADRLVASPHIDRVIRIDQPQGGFLDKVLCISQVPYDHFLFLDADTYICGDITSLFDLLDHFDVAVAHDTFRTYTYDYNHLKNFINCIPETFPMFNSGVILFKRSGALQSFFEEWKQIYRRDLQSVHTRGGSYCGDQASFREALYHSKLRIATLPTEYNCRFVHACFLNMQVKILHGPDSDLAGAETEINRIQGNRVFTPRLGVLPEDQGPFLLSRWYLKNSARKALSSLHGLKKRGSRLLHR